MDRERALALIYDTIDRVNPQLPPAQRLARGPSTVIVGPGGVLDSLGIVNFVLALEERAADALGRSVPLLDTDRIADATGPFRTVGSLADHLTALGAR